MTKTEMNACCETLKAKYPEAQLSFGYIGNCGHDRYGAFDDRSWYFFTQIPLGTTRAKLSLGKDPEAATQTCFPNGEVFDGSYQLSKEQFNALVRRPLQPEDVEAWLVRQLDRVFDE